MSEYNPFEASSAASFEGTGTVPAAVGWYRAYCWLNVAMYTSIAVLFPMLLLVEPDTPAEDTVGAVVMAVMCAPLALLYLAGAVRTRPQWGWTYGLVLICLTLTSMCCLPLAIPLLIQWIKPETKAYFGK